MDKRSKIKLLDLLKKEFRKDKNQKKIMDSTVVPLFNNIINKNKKLISLVVFIVVFILSILIFNTYQLSSINTKIIKIIKESEYK